MTSVNFYAKKGSQKSREKFCGKTPTIFLFLREARAGRRGQGGGRGGGGWGGGEGAPGLRASSTAYGRNGGRGGEGAKKNEKGRKRGSAFVECATQVVIGNGTLRAKTSKRIGVSRECASRVWKLNEKAVRRSGKREEKGRVRKREL